ncbi:hypothetical protein ACWC0A_10210 [Streptomyces scopuliridis]
MRPGTNSVAGQGCSASARLLQRSATTVLIPGTSSVAHLRENVAAANLGLPADAVTEPAAIAPRRSAG